MLFITWLIVDTCEVMQVVMADEKIDPEVLFPDARAAMKQYCARRFADEISEHAIGSEHFFNKLSSGDFII